jgi:LytS/YehU family sensor histidine kinase
VAYTLLVIYLVMMLYRQSLDVRMGTTSTIFSIVITIMISLFMHGRAFFINWRQVAINAEKLKQENMAARYESLKNQVNPHFLFNSFNALTNLVYEDPDKAVKFIKQLSDVYRYVLDTRDKEVVPLDQEMRFLQSYLYLQKIRFGDKLVIQFDVDGLKTQVAPLALQMLIENAIKHNVVSEDDPLHIHVFADNGFLVVENNLQKKTSLGEPSAGVGLENICRRYEYLSSAKAEVRQTSDKFIVRLPLIAGAS